MPLGAFRLNSIAKGSALAPIVYPTQAVKFGTTSTSGYYADTAISEFVTSSNAGVTFAAWVKPTKANHSGSEWWAFALTNTDSGNYSFLMSVKDNGDLRIYRQLAPGFQDFNPIVTNAFPTANQWYHVAVALNSATQVIQVYINGVAQTTSGTLSTTNSRWDILNGIYVGGQGGTRDGRGDIMTQVWADNSFVDLSTNISKFYNNGYVNMGTSGTTSGLSQPMFFHDGSTTSTQAFSTRGGRTSGQYITYNLLDNDVGTISTYTDDAASYSVPAAGFTDDSNTKILLKFDGGFTDTVGSGRTAKTITQLSTPTRSSTVFKYGTQSLIAAGGATFPSVHTGTTITDFVFANKDFTCEYWIYLNAYTNLAFGFAGGVPKTVTLSDGTNNAVQWGLGCNNNGAARLFYWDGSSGRSLESAGILSLGAWHHIAFDHRVSDGRIRLFANGQIAATATRIGNNTATSPRFQVGGFSASDSTSHWNGFVDEVRVSHTLRY